MKFEVGKYYRTGVGNKALIVDDNFNGQLLAVIECNNNLKQTAIRTQSGHLISEDKPCEQDLVGEWVEPLKLQGWGIFIHSFDSITVLRYNDKELAKTYANMYGKRTIGVADLSNLKFEV